MLIKNIKGTKEYLPNEQIKRKKVIQIIEEKFEKYGFKPVETPILNFKEFLESKYGGGDEIIKEIYNLKDQGKRELSLRYDLTQPFIKLISSNPKLRLPVKRYEIGKVFRDGPIKKGRLREFTQCDADVLGIKELSIDAELFSIIRDVSEDLEISFIIQYNNVKILNGVLSEFTSQTMVSKVVLILDKYEKIGFSGIKSELNDIGFNETYINKIKEFINICEEQDLSKLEQNYDNDLVRQGIKEINELNKYLNSLGLKENINLNLLLARGLSIYSGTVFEAFTIESEIKSSFASGGRYDNALSALSQNSESKAAIGLSLGLDVIHEIINEKNILSSKSNTDIYIIPINTLKESMKIANEIRKNTNLNVEIDMSKKNVMKSFDYANKERIPFTIPIGEEELSTNSISIKNMDTGDNINCSLKNIGTLSNIIAEQLAYV